jgi:hypothetical protein
MTKTQTVVTRSFSIDTGKKRVSYSTGQVLTSSQIRSIGDRRRRDYTTDQPVVHTRDTWSPDMIYLLGDLYNTLSDPTIDSDNRMNIRSEFMSIHTWVKPASVDKYIRQCVCVDKKYTAAGLSIVSRRLCEFLNAMDSDRYMTYTDYQEAVAYAS